MSIESIRVLLVDDATEERDEINAALVVAGCTIRCADDAASAIGALAVQRPSVLVVDIRLPHGEAHLLLAALAEPSATDDVPTILIGEMPNLVKSMPITPYGLVATPVDIDHLVSTVQRAARRGDVVGVR